MPRLRTVIGALDGKLMRRLRSQISQLQITAPLPLEVVHTRDEMGVWSSNLADISSNYISTLQAYICIP